MKRSFALLVTLVLALSCLGMGKRASKHVVSFHLATEPEFAASKRVFEWPAGSGYFYEKSPTIHYRQIRAFSAFDGDDGGWGAVFRLTTAVTKLGRYNDDGQIVIWEKLRPDDMELFEKKFAVFQ